MKVKGLKKYLFLFFFFLTCNSTYASNYKNNCNFITGNFINEILILAHQKYDIQIANSKKYYVNASNYIIYKGKGNLLIKNLKEI